MIPRWLVHGAAFIVVWFGVAIILGVLFAAFVRFKAREPDWPPEWEPGDEPGDDGLYADAGAEIDQWHEETPDGNA